MGTAMPDRVKPSCVIFDIRALWRSGLSDASSVPGCHELQKWRLNLVCHRMYLYGNSGRQRVNYPGVSFVAATTWPCSV